MEKLAISKSKIKDMIYEVRGVQVILDSDLAKLYHVETRVFNQSVKRNIKRFPDDFRFQLTTDEYINIRSKKSMSSQNVTTSTRPLTSLPYVFTEQGVSMLAGVLQTDIAIQHSIKIIKAFVEMKKYFNTSLIEQKHVNELVYKHEDKINLLEESFSKFQEKAKTTDIYFSGQMYDAYSAVLKIFNTAKKELIIIDPYADNTLLDIIKRLNIKENKNQSRFLIGFISF